MSKLDNLDGWLKRNPYGRIVQSTEGGIVVVSQMVGDVVHAVASASSAYDALQALDRAEATKLEARSRR